MAHNEHEPVQKTSPRDFFLHLLAIVTLYVSAISFTTLLFQYINIYFADQLEADYYMRLAATSAIRWSIASLFVIFPVYAITTWFLNKAYAATPYKRNLRIRKWLIYFTLFATALIIIGDLVALIFRLLGGDELTARFALKVVTILIVTGSVFAYYLWELKDAKNWNIKPFVYSLIGIVAVAIVSGFFIVGSPKEARLRKADDARVSDLQGIQGQLIYYYQSKAKLPANLDALTDTISGYRAPMDPETGAPYEYIPKTKLAGGILPFELCATFNRPSASNELSRAPIAKPYPAESVPAGPYPASEINDNWSHDVGRTCFERTIDPELYKPFGKVRN